MLNWKMNKESFMYHLFKLVYVHWRICMVESTCISSSWPYQRKIEIWKKSEKGRANSLTFFRIPLPWYVWYLIHVPRIYGFTGTFYWCIPSILRRNLKLLRIFWFILSIIYYYYLFHVRSVLETAVYIEECVGLCFVTSCVVSTIEGSHMVLQQLLLYQRKALQFISEMFCILFIWNNVDFFFGGGCIPMYSFIALSFPCKYQ